MTTTINRRPYWVTYFDLELSVECADSFTAEELESLKFDPMADIIKIENNIIDAD